MTEPQGSMEVEIKDEGKPQNEEIPTQENPISDVTAIPSSPTEIPTEGQPTNEISGNEQGKENLLPEVESLPQEVKSEGGKLDEVLSSSAMKSPDAVEETPTEGNCKFLLVVSNGDIRTIKNKSNL